MKPIAKAAHSLCILAALAALPACPETKADPVEAFKKFQADVHGRRSDAVWAELTSATQSELERRHRALRDAMKRDAGKETEPMAAEILFDELGLMRLNEPESTAVVSPPGQEVMLRVSVKDGRSADIKMVREGQTWKVDLMGSLAPAPPLDRDLKGKVEKTDTATVP